MSDSPYSHLSPLFIDSSCGDYIADLIDYLDYADTVDIYITLRPVYHIRPVRLSYGDGTPDNPVDLTDGDDSS